METPLGRSVDSCASPSWWSSDRHSPSSLSVSWGAFMAMPFSQESGFIFSVNGTGQSHPNIE